MRAEPGGRPAAASSAAAAAARRELSYRRLLAVGLGSAAFLLVTTLLAYALIAARVPQHRAALEQLVRHETGLDISFSALSVHWGWYGPEAVFHDIAVGEARGGPALRAPELVVALDAWRMARSGRFEAGHITLVNPDISLDSPRATTPALAPAQEIARESAWQSAARLLARWRGDRLDLQGGILRLPSGEPGPSLIVSLRSAQLRRHAQDWSLDARALLPDSLGEGVQLTASVHGDMARPQTLHGSVRVAGERLAFGGWQHVATGRSGVAYLPGAGTGNLELNLRLERGAVASIGGALRAESLEWLPRAAGAAPLRLPRLRADWQLTQRAGGWVLSVHNLDAGDGIMSSQVLLTDSGAQGQIRSVPLGLAAEVARWNDPQLAFTQLALGGMVQVLNFSWDARRGTPIRVSTLAHLEGLSIADASNELALSGLNATVSGNGTQLLVELSADNAQIASVRGQPARIAGLAVNARVLIGTDGTRWHVATRSLEIRGEGMQVAARGTVAAGAADDAGRIDAHVELRDADAVILAGLLGPRTGSAFGLEAGRIRAGRIASGDLELHGPLYVDTQAMQPAGEFRGSLELRDASLAGDESWPPLQELNAHLDWRADRVEALITQARSGSFKVSTARLQWDPRSQRAVHFSGRLSGQAEEALQWLRDRPEVGRYVPALASIDLRGETLLDVDVRPQLRPNTAPRVRVTAVLDGTRFYPLVGVPAVEVQHGALAFSDGRLQRAALTGRWLGGPVTLGIEERREHAQAGVAISARGTLEVRQALAAAGAADHDAGVVGSTEWTAQVNVPVNAVAGSARWNLRADSALVGVASHLPEPFAKSADASVPLHVEMQGADSGAQLRVTLGERLRALVALQRGADAWRIERGAMRVAAGAPVLPAEPVFTLEGRVSRLDLPQYLALWRAAAADTALPDIKGDVTAAELALGTRSYPEVRVLARASRRAGELELQSEMISATVRWPDAEGQQPARLELARFDATDVAGLLQATELAGELAPVTRFAVEDLRWQERSLGRLSALLTYRSGELSFSEARLSGANEDTRGNGGCRAGRCTVSFSLNSTDAGATLQSFGLRPDLQAQQASLSGELHWRTEGEPALASLGGSLHMLLSMGTTRPPAQPAQGEPFPFFVVPALLAGIGPEGRNTAQPAVRFTRLSASYDLRDGAASTTDLHLDGDAEILVRARLGLLERDYQGDATVLRGEERLPAALRGLGGAPKIAAAWLALRGWLTGSEGNRGRIELRLRGPWDDPIVSVP